MCAFLNTVNISKYPPIMLTAITWSSKFRILKPMCCFKWLRSKSLSWLHEIQRSLQCLLYAWIFLLCSPDTLWMCRSCSDLKHRQKRKKPFFLVFFKSDRKKSHERFRLRYEQIPLPLIQSTRCRLWGGLHAKRGAIGSLSAHSR